MLKSHTLFEKWLTLDSVGVSGDIKGLKTSHNDKTGRHEGMPQWRPCLGTWRQALNSGKKPLEANLKTGEPG